MKNWTKNLETKEIYNVNEDITKMNNEDLLQELISAHEDMKDYIYRADWVRWSQEKEDEATNKYIKIENEVLKRMGSE